MFTEANRYCKGSVDWIWTLFVGSGSERVEPSVAVLSCLLVNYTGKKTDREPSSSASELCSPN